MSKVAAPYETRNVAGNFVQIHHGDLWVPTAQTFSKADTIAVDIETTGPDRDSLLDFRRGRPALVTLYAEGLTPALVRIDPAKRPNWLCSLLWSAGTRKIFHYARFDLSFMMHHWQVRAANVACTRMGAKFCGFEPPQQSLAPQVEYFLEYTMKKGQALSDWTLPSLTDEQVLYALEDVLYLRKLLAQQKKHMGAEEAVDFQKFCDFLPTYVWYEIHDKRPAAYFER